MIHSWEMEELCLYAMGKNEDEVNHFINNDEDIDSACFDFFEIDFDNFCRVADKLLSFTPQLKTAITNVNVNAFIRLDQRGAVAIVQREANHD